MKRVCSKAILAPVEFVLCGRQVPLGICTGAFGKPRVCVVRATASAVQPNFDVFFDGAGLWLAPLDLFDLGLL